MSKFVRLVTAWLTLRHAGALPKASARVMQARRPVNATEPLIAELFNSTAMMRLAILGNGRLTFGSPSF
jgi:hypothetical protein